MKELIRGPMDEAWFIVAPAKIDRSLFGESRKDAKQEKVRSLIAESLDMVCKDTRFYKKTFKTFRPEKIFTRSSEFSLFEQARWNGNYLGSWIEQALEWAQRIQNGEAWETLCNEKDDLRWYRMIIWRDGEIRLIGGSTKNGDKSSPTKITGSDDVNFKSKLENYTIPLVVKC